MSQLAALTPNPNAANIPPNIASAIDVVGFALLGAGLYWLFILGWKMVTQPIPPPTYPSRHRWYGTADIATITMRYADTGKLSARFPAFRYGAGWECAWPHTPREYDSLEAIVEHVHAIYAGHEPPRQVAVTVEVGR